MAAKDAARRTPRGSDDDCRHIGLTRPRQDSDSRARDTRGARTPSDGVIRGRGVGAGVERRRKHRGESTEQRPHHVSAAVSQVRQANLWHLQARAWARAVLVRLLARGQQAALGLHRQGAASGCLAGDYRAGRGTGAAAQGRVGRTENAEGESTARSTSDNAALRNSRAGRPPCRRTPRSRVMMPARSRSGGELIQHAVLHQPAGEVQTAQ